jgi:ceramide glucosyltransferase
MAPFARFDHWVISDSNVAVSPDYVTDLMSHMQQPGVGLVTSLIRGVGGRTLGARMENLHLNGYIAGSTLAVNELSRVPVSIGKSMLMRKETMNRLGGFAHFADYLLEDGLLGQEIRKLGYQTRTTFHAVNNVNNSWSMQNFASRHFRWAVMRRHLNLGHYGAEILSNPIGLSAGALLLSPSFGSLAITGTIWTGKVICDLMSAGIMGGDAGWRSALVLPVKDLIIAGIWPIPFFVNRVNWRGNILRVGKMTRATWLGRRRSNGRSGTSIDSHFARRAFRMNFRWRRPALQREAA